MRRPRKRTRTFGFLDEYEIRGGRLTARGWALSPDDGPIDGFRLTLGDEVVEAVEWRIGLPSPDVAKAHSVRGSDRARFELTARNLPRATPEHTLVGITPVVGGAEGAVLYGLPQARLPRPSEEDILSIGGGFEAVGLEFLGLFVQLAGLEPKDRVLDVGCGIGRMAHVLFHYLDGSGSYEGFDVFGRLIEWDQKNITPHAPWMRFQHAAIHHAHYNINGQQKASEFVFPYPAASFEFVFLTSVFTHLHGPEVRHYIDEISRVLVLGGRCLISCFLLDDEARALIASGASRYNITVPIGDAYSTALEEPEYCMGYDSPLLLGWLSERRLRPIGVYPGNWCGRTRNFTSVQDIVVCQK